MSLSTLEATPPSALGGNGMHAAEPDPEAVLAGVRQCSECDEPIGSDRSPDAKTCSRRCADVRGKRGRAQRLQDERA